MVLFLLHSPAQAQAIGNDEHSGNNPEPSSQPRIVTQHCDESISNVLGEMIKYYIDQGDFESAGALTEVAKKYQMADNAKPIIKVPHRKPQADPWTYDNFKHWIFGYF